MATLSESGMLKSRLCWVHAMASSWPPARLATSEVSSTKDDRSSPELRIHPLPTMAPLPNLVALAAMARRHGSALAAATEDLWQVAADSLYSTRRRPWPACG
jgi:hypothetical protein